MTNWQLRAALFLIRAAAAPDDARHIEGDLIEEFEMDPELSAWWPLAQALSSLPALARQHWDARQFAGGVTAAAIVVILSHSLHAFALSQVPLRASHGPGAAWLIVTAAVALAAALTGSRKGGRRLSR